MTTHARAPVLEIEDLTVSFDGDDGLVPVLDGFGLTVSDGACVGVVGESGSGKSTAFLAALRLLPASARVRARRLRSRGDDLLALSAESVRRIRGRRIGLVSQDPSAALNPYLTIGLQLAEAIQLRRGARGSDTREEAASALVAMRLESPGLLLRRHPHELSGGQRQRVAIAMALLGEPELLVADEPTTALDPTVQAEVLALLLRIRRERGLSLALVSHDLGVVAGVADRVAVVYAGRVVEEAPVASFFERPRHPYSAALLESAPRLDGPRPQRLAAIPGGPPAPGTAPDGCAFAPRCGRANDRCRGERPPEVVEGDRRFACFDPIGSAP